VRVRRESLLVVVEHRAPGDALTVPRRDDREFDHARKATPRGRDRVETRRDASKSDVTNDDYGEKNDSNDARAVSNARESMHG